MQKGAMQALFEKPIEEARGKAGEEPRFHDKSACVGDGTSGVLQLTTFDSASWLEIRWFHAQASIHDFK